MTVAALDVVCPRCAAPAGSGCEHRGEPLRHDYYHSERANEARRPHPSVKIDHMRAVYDAALSWRRQVTLVPVDPRTAALIATIDAAIDAENT